MKKIIPLILCLGLILCACGSSGYEKGYAAGYNDGYQAAMKSQQSVSVPSATPTEAKETIAEPSNGFMF